jgi:hypothetical protein
VISIEFTSLDYTSIYITFAFSVKLLPYHHHHWFLSTTTHASFTGLIRRNRFVTTFLSWRLLVLPLLRSLWQKINVWWEGSGLLALPYDTSTLTTLPSGGWGGSATSSHRDGSMSKGRPFHKREGRLCQNVSHDRWWTICWIIIILPHHSPCFNIFSTCPSV